MENRLTLRRTFFRLAILVSREERVDLARPDQPTKRTKQSSENQNSGKMGYDGPSFNSRSLDLPPSTYISGYLKIMKKVAKFFPQTK